MSKITSTKGCTAFNLEMDDERIIEMPEYKQRYVLNSIIKHLLKHNTDPSNLIDHLVEEYGEFNIDDDSCGSCGDTVSWTTLEIDL